MCVTLKFIVGCHIPAVTMAYYSSYDRSGFGTPYSSGHRSYTSSSFSSPYAVRSVATGGSYLPVSVFFPSLYTGKAVFIAKGRGACNPIFGLYFAISLSFQKEGQPLSLGQAVDACNSPPFSAFLCDTGWKNNGTNASLRHTGVDIPAFLRTVPSIKALPRTQRTPCL